MPIMDGHTSTKEIRSFESSACSNSSSQGDSLPSKGRVPIIAVSATLVERERDFYIDVGFDGWILKPIPFDRLRHIMSGVADPVARKEDLYKSGCWEKAGWFKEAQKDDKDDSSEQGDEENEEK
jgi:DNA-binding response OmpR family regulator